MKSRNRTKILQGLLLAAPVFAALAPAAALALRARGGPALLFLAFWVVLPGAALARLLGLNIRSGWFLLYAFFLGAAALFGLFYALRLPGLPLAAAAWGLRLAPPLAGLLGAAWWVKDVGGPRAAARALGAWAGALLDGGQGFVPGGGPGPNAGRAGLNTNQAARRAACLAALRRSLPLWLMALAAWAAFILTAVAYRGPTQAGLPDYYWHMGNIHTLAASPGFEDIRVAGMTFRYHYFADLLWAAGRLALGLEPFYCVLRYPALVAPLCAAAVWGIMGRGTRRPWLRFAACFVVLFAAPLYGIYNDFTYQWATGINAVGLALPCALLLLHTGIQALEKPRAGWRDLVLVGVLAAMTAGLKGPFALCVLAALCGGLLARWLAGRLARRAGPGLTETDGEPSCKKIHKSYAIAKNATAKNWWLVLLAGAAGFALIWFTLLRAGLNESYIKSWQPFYSVYTAEVLAPLLTTGLGSPAWVRALLMPLHLLVVLGALAVPFVAACVRFLARLIRRRPLGDMPLFCLAGAVASLLVFYMLDLTGRSQFYFLYFAVPMAGVVAAREVGRHWIPWLRARKRVLVRTLAVLAAAALVAFALAHPMVQWGADHYSQYELEAARVLAAQARPGQRAAINRHVVHYFTSAMSGVQFWLEGDAYAKNSGLSMEDLAGQRELGDALFQADKGGTPWRPGEKRALAESMGVSFLVQYLRDVGEHLTAEPGEGFELVYDSPDVRVWKTLPWPETASFYPPPLAPPAAGMQ